MPDPMTHSKISAKLDKVFHKIFNPSHIAYNLLLNKFGFNKNL